MIKKDETLLPLLALRSHIYFILPPPWSPTYEHRACVSQAAIVCYGQKIALTCALLGVLGLESIKQEDKEFAGWVHFTDQPEDVAYISPHIVFSFPNLAKHNQISQVSLKMLRTTHLMLSLVSST